MTTDLNYASLDILFRFIDFGADGGPAAKELAPKLDLTKSHLSSRFGVALPNVEVWPLLLSYWVVVPCLHVFNAVYILYFCLTWKTNFKRWNKSYGLLLLWKDLEAYSLLSATSLVPIFWLGFLHFC